MMSTVLVDRMAEGVGFEPTIRYSRIPVFETGAFNRSATPPVRRDEARTGRARFQPPRCGGVRYRSGLGAVFWTALVVLLILWLLALLLGVGRWTSALPVLMSCLLAYRLLVPRRRRW